MKSRAASQAAPAVRAFVGTLALLLAPGCRQDMHDQPRYEPLEESRFFADGRSSRPQVPGTVARGRLRIDEHLYRGTVDGEPAATFPYTVDAAMLERGRERYGIFCTPCHDPVGYGVGPVVLRGMKQPPSFHVERLREASPGYLFDVITRGFGTMLDLADRIPARDRWAIVAYVRVLQRSQNATLADLAPDKKAELEAQR